MTEKSYVWSGVLTGDATLAPYNADEFNPYITAYSQPLRANNIVSIGKGLFAGGVVPDYLDELKVEYTGFGRTIVIRKGAAVIRDRVYISDIEHVLEIGLNPVLSSADVAWWIALRLDKTTQTVYPVVHRFENEYPPQFDNIFSNIPNYWWTGDTWELPLATVFVKGSTTALVGGDIRDWRRFVDHTLNQRVGVNLLDGTEHIVWGNNTVNSVPTRWYADSANTGTITGSNTNVNTARSSAINLNASPANYAALFYNLTVPESDEEYEITLTGKVRITAVATGASVVIRLLACDSNDGQEFDAGIETYPFTICTEYLASRVKFQINNDGGLSESQPFILRLSVPPNTPNIVIHMSASYATANIEQLVLVKGKTTGELVNQHDFMMAEFTYFTDAGWFNVAKVTGVYTIDLSATFTNYIRDSHCAVLSMGIRDTNSAAGAPYAEIVDITKNAVLGRIDLAGTTNSQVRDLQVLVPLQKAKMTTGAAGVLGWRVNIVASGVLTIYINIVGLVT